MTRNNMQPVEATEAPVLLTDKEVAPMLGVARRTLKGWRVATPPKGPPFTYVGGDAVRYPLDGLKAYIAAHTITPKSSTAA